MIVEYQPKITGEKNFVNIKAAFYFQEEPHWAISHLFSH